MSRPRLSILVQPSLRASLFHPATLDAIHDLADVTMYDRDDPPRDLDAARLTPMLADADVLMNSWGSPKLDQALLDTAPRLKLVIYLAGSVKAFETDAMWRRGVRVASCATAIADSVVEFVVGLAIVARRDVFRLSRAMRASESAEGEPRELWGSTVGIVSLGNIGRRVAQQLQPFGVGRMLAYDPFVSDEAAAALGVELVELDDLLRQSDLITLHTPNLPQTRGMLSRERLKLIRDGAVLINSARGDLIDEAALIDELRSGRFFACLDVTSPEPPALDSLLRTLPNVLLTPHIAGPRSRRIGEQGLEELKRYLSGRPPVYEMTRERLAVTG